LGSAETPDFSAANHDTPGWPNSAVVAASGTGPVQDQAGDAIVGSQADLMDDPRFSVDSGALDAMLLMALPFS
jgi:hypothetical protein